ncbi:MAG: sensor histidine kinase [Cyclobacteriaceae bacterium]
MKSISLVEWSVHVLIVIATLALLNYPQFDLTIGVFSSGNLSLLWPSIVGTVLNLLLFYTIAFYLIPEILRKKAIPEFALLLLLLFAVISGVEIFCDSLFLKSQGQELDNYLWGEIVTLVIVVHLLVIIVSFAYRFSKDWFANEELKRNINEWQLRTELDILKSQINPHFLFNSLNNLFSMSLKNGDEKTAEGISKLSEMMRYVFDKSSREQVSIEEEIQYLEDYIYMEHLRFENHVHVQFNHQHDGSVTLAPMLLISFLENAFKYGVGTNGMNTIVMNMTARKGVFEFTISNKVVEQSESIPSSGIGIENVKKRLDLLYPESHELKISEQNNNFDVSLTIHMP